MAQAQRRVYTPPPEAPPYQHVHHDDDGGGKRQAMMLVIMLIVMVTFGYVTWTMYGGAKPAADAPVIAGGEFKQRYDGPPVDELATTDIDRALEGRAQKTPPAPVTRGAVEEPLPAAVSAAPKAAAKSAIPKSAVPQSTAAPKAPPAPNAPAAHAAANGGFVAQIAALRSDAAAGAAWDRLAHRDPALFANASKDVQRADLGPKGVYYRVRAGYFAQHDEASRFCDRVKTLGQECIVVVR